MPYPHLRSDERGRNAAPRSVGISVRTGDGERFLFPGGTIELASFFMNAVLSEKTLTDPLTGIEFGYTHNGSWVCERQLKKPSETA